MRFFRKRRVEKRFYISITSSKTSGEPAPEVFYVEFANDLLKRIGINDIKFSADFSYYSSKTPAFIRDVEEIALSRAQEWIEGEPYSKCVTKALEDIARKLALRLDVMNDQILEEDETDIDQEDIDQELERDPWATDEEQTA